MAFDRGTRAPLMRGAIVDPARLSALDDLGPPDTEPTEAFDRLTRLASLSLDAPIALLSLIDHDRRLPRSGVGIPDGLGDIPATSPLCRLAIETRAPVVVDDLRRHPLVGSDAAGHGTLAYAGAPVVTGDGHAVGTLCVADAVPRRWTGREVSILTCLADIAADQIDSRVRVRPRTVPEWPDGSRAHLGRAREEAVRRMARAVVARSDETADHVARMSGLCAVLALGLGFSRERSELIRLASMLHDVGKIAVPDTILMKAGPLTVEERAEMQDHVLLGYEMLRDSDDAVLGLAAAIALTHHERVDGLGYPRGLRGDEIPIEGRIAAVADVFDALTIDRVYREALHPRAAFAVMQHGRGTQFDPRVLDALAAHVEIATADAEAAPTAAPHG